MQVTYSEGPFIDYRYMDLKNIAPRFEFGFGLSYTTFSYASLSLIPSGTSQLVSFTVTNTGALAGTEIVQLYLSYPSAAGEPKRVLRGFEEVPLEVGASATVTITLDAREMRYAFDFLLFLLADKSSSDGILGIQYMGYAEPDVGSSTWDIYGVRGGIDQGCSVDWDVLGGVSTCYYDVND